MASATERRAEACALAQALGLPCLAEQSPPGGCDLLLVLTPERLELHDRRDTRLKPLAVDLAGLRHARLTRRQPLARALGRRTRRVVDATAGLGADAARLAALGFEVTAIERSPVVAALLRDGLERAQRDPVLARLLGDRLTVLTGDARERLPAMRPPPDAVYLDPMFPPRRKASAATRKELAWLRELVGTDPDAHELLAIARACSPRVVVKRPDDAPPLAPDPALTFSGKLVRYDVYLAHGRR